MVRGQFAWVWVLPAGSVLILHSFGRLLSSFERVLDGFGRVHKGLAGFVQNLKGLGRD